ncbi:hypothetical protein [Burkholderia sp. LS-044]|uniref:hypothetical protein n=1 Tax=Burkholderia sp. LS-044 TaxID=1459967 RepID=UPI001FFF644D|nr:hypothetical protein [Burkholderia sp. LS-044]
MIGLEFGGQPADSHDLLDCKRRGKYACIPAARASYLDANGLTLGRDSARHDASWLLAQIERKIETCPVEP